MFALIIAVAVCSEARAEGGTLEFHGHPLAYVLPAGWCEADPGKSELEALLLEQLTATGGSAARVLLLSLPCADIDRFRNPEDDLSGIQAIRTLSIVTGASGAPLNVSRSEYLSRMSRVQVEPTEVANQWFVATELGEPLLTQNAMYVRMLGTSTFAGDTSPLLSIMAFTMVMDQAVFATISSLPMSSEADPEGAFEDMQALIEPFMDELVRANGKPSDLTGPEEGRMGLLAPIGGLLVCAAVILYFQRRERRAASRTEPSP